MPPLTELRSPIEGTASYSSLVELALVVNAISVPLAEIGPNHVTLAKQMFVAQGQAEIVMHVDGSPQRWPVEILPHAAGSLSIPIRDRC